MDRLVSIIMPCYNGEQYVHRMLKSICDQTYKHLELIIINDGSTDRTEDIISSFKDRFDALGYKFIYIKQENQGQSVAINQGLKLFTGDYISFIDSDDILSEDAIFKKVAYMEAHPNIGLLINTIQVLDFDTLNPIGFMKRHKPNKETITYDLISGQNVFYTPGGYFWRTSMFKEAMTSPIHIASPREIGQNFQLLLPIAYKFPVGYIEDVLYFYLVRKGSHSRIKHSLKQDLHIWSVARDVLKSIIVDMEQRAEVRQTLFKRVDARYNHELMKIYLNHKERKKYIEYRDKWIDDSAGNGCINKLLFKYNYIINYNKNLLKGHLYTCFEKIRIR